MVGDCLDRITRPDLEDDFSDGRHQGYHLGGPVVDSDFISLGVDKFYWIGKRRGSIEEDNKWNKK